MNDSDCLFVFNLFNCSLMNSTSSNIIATEIVTVCRKAVLCGHELHQLRTAMHHHPQDPEIAINLSIPSMSGPGEVSCVESN